jgi:signal transduction histidine kinase
MTAQPNHIRARPSPLPPRLGPEIDGAIGVAFLAETSRCLADSLDYRETLATVAGLALPRFGVWCMVDIVEPDSSIRRVAVIHPEPEKQRVARDFYLAHPPQRDDPIGAPRVIRTQLSEFAAVAVVDALEGIADVAHRELLTQLGARSFLIVALRARGRTLGAITFVSDDDQQHDGADLLLAEDLGRRCAMAIDNARLYGEAEAARRAAESNQEAATFAEQRADALRAVAESARQDAESANRAKAAFLTTMSHEFRTPLGAILGFVGLLNDELVGPLTIVQRDYLTRIGKASGHLLRLIEEVLTISQVHADRGTIQVEEANLSAVMHEVAELFLPLVASNRLSLRLDLPDTPVLFATDASKFRQIVVNLAGNAVKFTESGEIHLKLVEEFDAIVLSVRDTGGGISPAEVERLFESFWQAGTPGAEKARGTGLGLAITRQLTQLMGGTVSVVSTPGVGSTFTVRLPHRRDPVGAEPEESASVRQRPSTPGSGLRAQT